jgi:phosphohistidine phosphatase
MRKSMRSLYVLRHAKSSWEDTDLSDHERPLNDRGRRAAPLMGQEIARRGYRPDVIIASTAYRAAATAKLVKEAGGLEADIRLDDRVYEAGPQTLAKVLSDLDGSVSSAMIVGHNPGIEGLIRYLTRDIVSMPTAGLAVISLEIENWSEIANETGRLIELVRPRDIETSS